MSTEEQTLEYTQNKLYRDHYRIALGAAIFMSIICGLLVVVFSLISLSPVTPKYYATTTTGIIVPLHSLSEPVVTQSYLLQWAALSAQMSYNLNFTDYEAQIKSLSPYFTPAGFAKYQDALKSSGLLDTVINKKVMMSAIVSGDPVIVREFIESGRHNWVIQLPMLVTFQSASDNKRMHAMVTMRIQRVPVLGAENGIQISNFQVS